MSASPAQSPAAAVRRRAWLAAGIATAVTTTVFLMTATAQAATLFTDDFNDGNANGWSKSGGSWSVVTDGSPVYQQSSTGSDAKAQAGSAWGNQTVQARVKPLAFSAGSGRFVGIIGRAQSMTNYYYLALTNSQVVLGKRTSGGYTTLASASASVSIGTWCNIEIRGLRQHPARLLSTARWWSAPATPLSPPARSG